VLNLNPGNGHLQQRGRSTALQQAISGAGEGLAHASADDATIRSRPEEG
jgi:hypothetical protein